MRHFHSLHRLSAMNLRFDICDLEKLDVGAFDDTWIFAISTIAILDVWPETENLRMTMTMCLAFPSISITISL